MITAGHCIQNEGGTGIDWKHSGVELGDALGDTIVSGASNADAGWIDIDRGGITPRNKFYAGGAVPIRSATSIAYIDDQEIGDPICRGATVNGYMCGYINGLLIDKSSVDGHAVNNLVRTDFDASEGESGGPYFFGLQIYGIHADSKGNVDPPTAGTSWYTQASRAQNVGGFDFCLTSSC